MKLLQLGLIVIGFIVTMTGHIQGLGLQVLGITIMLAEHIDNQL